MDSDLTIIWLCNSMGTDFRRCGEIDEEMKQKLNEMHRKAAAHRSATAIWLPSAAPTAAGLPISARRCRNSAKRVRSVNAAAAMFPPQTWATIRQRSSG